MSGTELYVISNFTFLTGASHPEEMVIRACELGLSSIAVTDVNSFAGIVRGHAAAKELGIRYIVGVKLVLSCGGVILAYPRTREAYGQLCRLLTLGKRRSEKGKCELHLEDVLEFGEGSVLILPVGAETFTLAQALKDRFRRQVYIGLQPRYDGDDAAHFARDQKLAERVGLPLVTLGGALMHKASRVRLADVLSCIRERTVIDRLGKLAQPNAERRLKSEFEQRRLFKGYEEALAYADYVADQCRFSLDELKYEYPDEVTDGLHPDKRLRLLAEEGLKRRYPDGVPLNVRGLVEKELKLIRELNYARYFLTVHDVVMFARSKGILCQGRGSAANSVVCYALGVTEASPDMITMVFERFISEARNEPPDIDVDFEHERREEVIQHLFEKYGRHRAALCSTVIHFRSRAAIREVGKAMGLSVDVISALASQVWGWSEGGISEDRAKAAGLDVSDQRLRLTLELTQEIIGFPRHLSQHVGGFVITRGRLDEFCPIENAAMADRTVIEWDKDDIDVLGMLKVDVLALGMLTCIRKAFDLLKLWKSEDYTLASLPKEDPAIYDMLCEADTIGVFQVESRAQMNFLPRMRPRCFYDLVIEVAIIRPGPIQGNMVHPYIKRRRGEEAVVYPSDDLKPALGKTLGVPLFQEQAMQIAQIAAGFTASEADALRRALGSFRGPGSVQSFRDRFMEGCLARGYDLEFAQNCFNQLEGFSGYGFPESHAASFALLVYASSWIKCHHPEVFCCALLNSQPMGFYAPAQIIRDARAHGVTVLPVCIEHSYWDNVLEPSGDGSLAVRLGFRQVKGFSEEDGLWLASARGNGYRSIEAVWRRAGLGRPALSKLAGADAFAAHDLTRREALWSVQGLGGDKPLPLFRDMGEGLDDGPVILPAMDQREEVFEDYVSMRLTLRDHPVALLRPDIRPFLETRALRDTPDGRHVTVCGLVITRQRPGTASGVIFVTLEDETGTANVVVWPNTFKRYRKEVMSGRLLRISGRLQREGIVTHVMCSRIEDISWMLDGLGDASGGRDGIDPTYDNADEARRPIPVQPKDKQQSTGRPLPEAVTYELQKARHAAYGSGARHPREQAKKLFYSRDFH
ncbi:error-prone DNA polymerase [Ponticaulis sp.]|uniref:error-prone DNA polymerase n=1 Tax=Ponticaulis sp. TaxID=2020902 RepID=UPI000B725CE8|nr:error-prone DNA polymerase [Ponticaulis sp.]MAI91685.1 error-prone DNA polymerase [Ponticaulis sp.]OUX96948.1 MAG: error-prone DNA polymerase [Hyphomonadaceae bacterium TMED5]|tara:strand:+ start:14587 stop:17862 length:3276 start_codon:yes stop_codon:yes gene_type:complete